MERLTTFTPAFDKRHKNPSKNYGVHGCELHMVLKGKLGAVQFILYTNWMLPHVDKEFENRGADVFSKPLPADVGYHSPKPMYDEQPEREECQFLDGKSCYYDGSGLHAQTAFDVLVEGGSDGLWGFLEEYYIDKFGELK